MADFGITEGIALAAALAGTATSVNSAVQEKKATSAASDARKRAAAVEAKQLADATDLEKKKRLADSAKIRGRILAMAGEAGDAGSTDAILRQLDTDTGVNLDVLDTNLHNNRNRLFSGLNADLTSIGSRVPNSILAGFSGGVAGLGTGLSLDAGLRDAGVYRG